MLIPFEKLLPVRLNVRGELPDIRLVDRVEIPALRRVDRGMIDSFMTDLRRAGEPLDGRKPVDDDRVVATEDRVVPMAERGDTPARLLRDGCKVFGDRPLRENERVTPPRFEPLDERATDRLVVALRLDVVGRLATEDRRLETPTPADRCDGREDMIGERDERLDVAPLERVRVVRERDADDPADERDVRDREADALDLVGLDLVALDLLVTDRPADRLALEREPRERAPDDLDDRAPEDRGRLFADGELRAERRARCEYTSGVPVSTKIDANEMIHHRRARRFAIMSRVSLFESASPTFPRYFGSIVSHC